MKFAKVFEQALRDDSLPADWIDTAIQYKQLKKCISKVVDELHEIGIEKEALSLLFEENGSSCNEAVSASYGFENEMDIVDPNLVITVKHKDITQQGNISELVLENIDKLLRQRSGKVVISSGGNSEIIEIKEDSSSGMTKITINMSADSVFFHKLYQELKALDILKSNQEKKMIDEVSSVGKVVSVLSTPSKRKSDIYVWREIFKFYIDSEIFFSTSEFRPGERNVDEVKSNLMLFINRINSMKILEQFRHKRSVEAFNAFYSINLELLKALQFQTYNKLAITKILKKFDKQTSLRAKSKFPKLIKDEPFINASFSHTICAIIASRLLNLVPQLEDYTCPICCSVAFKPIRLSCGHVFCVRCLVKMQRKAQDHCPLCRRDVVMSADETNLDMARLQYLKLYFPKETKEKQMETEREIAKERFEMVYGPDQKCCIQ